MSKMVYGGLLVVKNKSLRCHTGGFLVKRKKIFLNHVAEHNVNAG